MNILEKFDKPTLSFEVFPKGVEYGTHAKNLAVDFDRMSSYGIPSWISVTCGAGQDGKFDVLENCIKTRNVACAYASHDFDTVQHITCAGMTRALLENQLGEYHLDGMTNFFCVRGDNNWRPEYRQTHQLVKAVRELVPEASIGVAGYPHPHPERGFIQTELVCLKAKLEAGADYIVTQMSFDVQAMLMWRDAVRDLFPNVKIVWGIMPAYDKRVIKKLTRLARVPIPIWMQRMLDDSDDHAVGLASIRYAAVQIIQLLAMGETHFHLYTMDNIDLARGVWSDLVGIF